MPNIIGVVPVLPISYRDTDRLRLAGYGLLTHQNQIVAVFQPLPAAIPFRKGDSDEDIQAAYQELVGD